MDFLHLSDLHYHRDPKDNAKVNQTMAFVREHFPKHHLIVTGDLSDDGHALQFENALNDLKPFLGRILVVPGNHDFGVAGNFYSLERAERFDRMISEPLGQGGSFHGYNMPVVNVVQEGADTVMVIALDSNLETEHPFDFACGQIGEGQLKGLDRILKEASPSMTKILILHHHPFIFNNPFMELVDARELMRTIYDRIDVIMFGHKHESKMWKEQELKGVKYALAADNAPGKDYARSLTVKNGKITVKNVKIA